MTRTSEAGIAHVIHQPAGVLRLAASLIEARAPELFAKYYPHRYTDSIGGYHSPKALAALLASIEHFSKHNDLSNFSITEILLAPALPYLVEHKMPLMFLGRDFLDAILHSDYPLPIEWAPLHLPYEHGVFVLPTSAVTTSKGNDLSFVLYSRKYKGRQYTTYSGHSYVTEENTFSISSLALDEDTWYNTNISESTTPIITLKDIFSGYGGSECPGFEHKFSYDADFDKDDAELAKTVGSIVFGTILALNAREDLLEPRKRLRVVQNKHDVTKRLEYWEPNFVGRHYHIKRLPAKGTHASPRLHWRRGHYRSQPFGPGRKERKIIWIEPCLIAGGETE